MKSTGIVRKVDKLGRVVIPMELRRIFDIDIQDPIEIYTDTNSIILKKYQPACIFCGDAKYIKSLNSKNICTKCIEKISKL